MTHPVAAFIAGLVLGIVIGVLIVCALIRSSEID